MRTGLNEIDLCDLGALARGNPDSSQTKQDGSRKGAKVAKVDENGEAMMKRDTTRSANGLPE